MTSLLSPYLSICVRYRTRVKKQHFVNGLGVYNDGIIGRWTTRTLTAYFTNLAAVRRFFALCSGETFEYQLLSMESVAKFDIPKHTLVH